MTQYLSANISNGKVELIEKELPISNESTFILKVKYTTICRADIKVLTSGGKTHFGHEVTGVYQGKNVSIDTSLKCSKTTGFAEYVIVDSENCFFEYQDIDPKKAALAEPFACVVKSYNHIENKGKTAILGAGSAGLIFGMLAPDNLIFNRGERRLEFAKTLFPNSVYSLNDYEKFKGTFDVAIIATSIVNQELLNIAYELIKKSGTIHLYGGTLPGDSYLGVDINNIRVNGLSQQIDDITISGIKGPDFKKAFELINDYPLEKIISKEITLQEFPEIINEMASGRLDFPGKVLIRF
ncbi:MAG: hypothetical protein COV59_02135 [Candidatus Magasanikbacteria bacterium CG11_big_fil_rev_8_21_14_0_20_39_34]|uniref:Uncharacterized protein n=1 Tax=Candidatus Magasanikbacteria bacterium CG11_big_fil_rev_8_21_14_0_20_39_34 TaxID=1974653 RepID=A0A2H0N4Y1_9BACT|nr:MAG: hypothetical protein COV59_02135 [Candidatus Magasanikbacteria bacterium CG11_big_fil_rev_8_21_14_0_20_39_34]